MSDATSDLARFGAPAELEKPTDPAFTGSGEMRRLCRELDWSTTPLGRAAGWPPSLRNAVQLALAAPFPSVLLWGESQVQIYNDAAAELLGARRGVALALPASHDWPHPWPLERGLLQRVQAGRTQCLDGVEAPPPCPGEPRRWFSLCYQPLRDEAGAVAGVSITAFETTGWKRTELTLQSSEQRQTFLLQLIDRLRSIDDPLEIQSEACRMLGEHLRASRVAYADVENEVFTVRCGYVAGVEPLPEGRQPVAAFGKFLLAAYRNREPTVFDDTEHDPRLTEEERSVYRAAQIRAFAAVMLVEGERWVGAFAVQQVVPRRWTDEELKLLRSVADRVWSAVQRARAQAALRDSEAKYRSLFESIAEGFAICELARDERGRVLDYRILEMNPAFERHRPVDAGLLATIARVLDSGQPTRFEHELPALGRCYEVRAFPGGEQRVAVLYEDITVRKRAEQLLRESEARQAFMLALSDELRPLADPVAIQAAASRLLAEQLEASRACYGECDEERGLYVIHREYVRDGGESRAGVYRIEDFASAWALLRTGQPLIVEDCTSAEVTREAAERYAALGIRAHVTAPLLKDGKLVAALAVGQNTARAWSALDIALVQETAERTWSAVERAHAENALRKAEQRRLQALSIETVGVRFFELDGRMLDVNPAFERMSGYGREELRRLGHWDALTAPGFETVTARAVAELGQRGETAPYEKQLIRRDGSRWWGLFAPTRVDGSGPSSECVEFVLDVTDAKRNEAALRASQERHAFFVRLADALHTLSNPALIPAQACRQLSEYLGGVSVSYADVGASDCSARLETNAERLVGAYKSGRVLVRSSRARAWTADEAEVTREVAERIWAAVERARAEAALRTSETRFRTLVENVHDYAILLLDGSGIVTEWTAGAERVMGYATDEVLGRNVALFYTHGDVRSGEVERELAEAASTGRAEREGWRVRKDGSRFWANEIATAVRDGDGHVVGFTKISRDLSEQRRLQQQREDLLAAVTAAHTEAERANKAKDEFLATLSHELRTPVAATLLWAGALRSGTVPLQDLGRAIDAIVQSAESQSRLIEDLLDLSRLASGKLLLAPRLVAVDAVARAAVDMIQPAAQSKGVALEVDLPEDLGSALLDPARLQQVLWNLLSNATKFTPRDGKVTLRIRKHDGQLEAEVIDTGEGISAEFMPHVFERFRQADMGETRRHAGLGIGLALCRHLVELQGGTITAESEGPGRGSLFRVRLPWLDPELIASEPETLARDEQPAAALEGVTVLLVEDDAHTREAMTWMLTRAGAIVLPASSAAEALTVMDGTDWQERTRRTAHVVLTDLGLPGISGYELLERIIERARTCGQPPPPAGAVSAHAREADRERALASGFDVYLAKPIPAERLIQAVEDLKAIAESEGV